MNHSVNRVYALCLLAALVATPMATLVLSHKRNCIVQKSPGIERMWTDPGLIAYGPFPHPKAPKIPHLPKAV
jgi:hypothetical protein